jgi:uncharacterized GH25 family protein
MVLWFMTLPASVSAHYTWLNATQYTLPEAGLRGRTVIYFGRGEIFPVHDFTDAKDLQRFYRVSPEGKQTEISPGEGGFLATRVDLSQKGTYIIAAERKPSFGAAFLEGGKLRRLREPKDKLPKGAQILESAFTVQSGKAIINVGEIESRNNHASRALGHELEIIPLKNPYQLTEGDYLPFQILFKGAPLRRPASDLTIKATYAGFSTEEAVFAYTADLDANGVAKVKILRYGVWQILAIQNVEPSGEMTGKADKLEYSASLTFEVK